MVWSDDLLDPGTEAFWDAKRDVELNVRVEYKYIHFVIKNLNNTSC